MTGLDPAQKLLINGRPFPPRDLPPGNNIPGTLYQIGILPRGVPLLLSMPSNLAVPGLLNIQALVTLSIAGPQMVRATGQSVIKGFRIGNLLAVSSRVMSRIGIDRSIKPAPIDIPFTDECTGVDIDDEFDHPRRVLPSTIRIAD